MCSFFFINDFLFQKLINCQLEIDKQLINEKENMKKKGLRGPKSLNPDSSLSTVRTSRSTLFLCPLVVNEVLIDR